MKTPSIALLCLLSFFTLSAQRQPEAFGFAGEKWLSNFFTETELDGPVWGIHVLYPAVPAGATVTRVAIGTQTPTADFQVNGVTALGMGGGKVGIGIARPNHLLSLGSSTARTKLALYENGPNNSYGLGVMPGSFRFHLNGSGARFAFFDSDEANANEIFTINGNGWVKAEILEITGGSDLAEPFDVNAETTVEVGMVVCIDPDHPGDLRLSDRPYDRTVAGVVSGANGLNPGLTLRQAAGDGLADGDFPVALAGRVYCRADASSGAIRPGDLLTTSGTPGHVMKVRDFRRAQGAVIGKAMTALEDGTGLVLVLVSLQ